jgi:hypothetical protein
MKTKSFLLAITFLTTGILYSQPKEPPKWGGARSSDFFTNWSLNFSGGLTTYFGDLSIYDTDLTEKLRHESGPALSLMLTKNVFRDAFGLSGQIVAGKIEGALGNTSFTAGLFEYNLQARVDFIDLFMLNKNHAFGITGFAGVGQFIFQTKKEIYNEGIIENTEHTGRVPEFVFFFGGGFNYKVHSSFGITAELGLRQCQNDRLDDEVRNDDFDYYSYASIGISYYINSFKRAPLKNKAKIANTSFMFDSPAHPAN